ncbi:hypothetical protein NRB20_75410 [Nocardia sp. RB20]|uniref:Uncharacterized protein n=1 Tax=Nocardia macrotermitis TaxID=2585198 RepID=A0A7K0DF42_9NOCA|nr:hypothetical protein [Nocardia macrotermitis]
MPAPPRPRTPHPRTARKTGRLRIFLGSKRIHSQDSPNHPHANQIRPHLTPRSCPNLLDAEQGTMSSGHLFASPAGRLQRGPRGPGSPRAPPHPRRACGRSSRRRRTNSRTPARNTTTSPTNCTTTSHKRWWSRDRPRRLRIRRRAACAHPRRHTLRRRRRYTLHRRRLHRYQLRRFRARRRISVRWSGNSAPGTMARRICCISNRSRNRRSNGSASRSSTESIPTAWTRNSEVGSKRN